MPKFVFKLDPVLRHRKQVEQERQRELAEAQAEMVRLEGQLRALDASVRDGRDDLRGNRLIGTLDMRFLAAHRRFEHAVRQEAVAVAQAMARQQARVQEAQGRLAEAAKERKILEKLRERHLDAWRAEQSRKEGIEADEVGSQIGYRWTVAAAAERQQEHAS